MKAVLIFKRRTYGLLSSFSEDEAKTNEYKLWEDKISSSYRSPKLEWARSLLLGVVMKEQDGHSLGISWNKLLFDYENGLHNW